MNPKSTKDKRKYLKWLRKIRKTKDPVTRKLLEQISGTVAIIFACFTLIACETLPKNPVGFKNGEVSVSGAYKGWTISIGYQL